MCVVLHENTLITSNLIRLAKRAIAYDSNISDRKSNLDFFQLINCSHFSKFSIQREYEVSKSSQGAGFLTCFHTGLYKASYNSRAISTNPA